VVSCLSEPKNLSPTTKKTEQGIDLPKVRLVVLHGLPRSATDMLQQAGRAGRDQRPADVLVLRLSSDTKSKHVAVDVKKACETGCLRVNLLKVFNQVISRKPTRCCSVCQPDPPAPPTLKITSGTPKRMAGRIVELKTDLEAIAQSSAHTSIFSPPASLLCEKEIETVCKAWDILVTEEDVGRLLRRSRLPHGIVGVLKAHRLRMATSTSTPTRTGASAASKGRRAEAIPKDMVVTFTLDSPQKAKKIPKEKAPPKERAPSKKKAKE